MRHYERRSCDGILRHGVPVVLGSNVAAVRGKILDGMVAAAMAEFQLRRVRAASERKQLVAKADAEDRIFAQQLLNHRYGMRYVLRVPRAVGQLNAVRIKAANLVGCRVMRHDDDVAAAASSAPAKYRS